MVGEGSVPSISQLGDIDYTIGTLDNVFRTEPRPSRCNGRIFCGFGLGSIGCHSSLKTWLEVTVARSCRPAINIRARTKIPAFEGIRLGPKKELPILASESIIFDSGDFYSQQMRFVIGQRGLLRSTPAEDRYP
jgi:hypothetical protein